MRLSNSNTSPTSIAAGGTNGTTEAESTPASQLVANSPAQPARDSSWLELDVCRDFQRQSCPRDANTCRFAHPENNPPFKSKVTCCYDFLKVGSPRFNSSAFFFFAGRKGILTTVACTRSKVGYFDRLQCSGCLSRTVLPRREFSCPTVIDASSRSLMSKFLLNKF